MAYIEAIDRMGGMVPAIERGYPQKEIAESAYQSQRAIESREQIIVGVNEFVSDQREERRPSATTTSSAAPANSAAGATTVPSTPARSYSRNPCGRE